MGRSLGYTLIILGFVLAILAYLFQDHLVLSKQGFAISISILRISTFFLLLFTSVTLIALGPNVVSRRLYLMGLFLVPALIPDMFHILSFSFFPDFITENKRHKTAYLYLFSRLMVLLALYLSVFGEKFFFRRYTEIRITAILSLISLLVSLGIVFYYPLLPSIFLQMDVVKPAWYKLVYDFITAFLFALIALYVHKRKVFGDKISPYVSLSVSFLSLSVFTFSLALHRHAFDFLLPLSSSYRLMGYSLLSFTILYLGVRKEAKAIMESTRKLLYKLMKEKPVNEKGIFYLEIAKDYTYGIENLYIYDLKLKRYVAQVYSEKRKEPPVLDVGGIRDLVKSLGGLYLGRDYHYSLYEDYMVVAEVTSEYSMDAESPLKRLHILNMERLLLSYMLNWINFYKVIEEKSKELQRLYLLLETSEYATQAYNNIDTFSKQVIERLDHVLKADGSIFYVWNKNAELPERVIFSVGFLQNFPELKTNQLLESVMLSPNTHGSGDKYIYCKFEGEGYQSGIVTLRTSRDFTQEDLLFLKTVSNQLFHVIRLMKVIEDLEKAQTSIKYLSEYDPLTSLYNRKSFEKLLMEEIERSDRYKEPLCTLFIDIDNFKVINDTYGYSVGDALLKHMGELIRRNVRRLDVVGRLGGDEFGVILPKANKAVAEYIANRLRQEIIQKPTILGDLEIHPSVSIGIVCCPLDADNLEELISMGEALMYTIKKEGKGRVKTVDESATEVYKTFRKVEREILDSLEKSLISVFLQEIVDLRKERVEGFEVLMRLSVNGELLPASKFIHIAEQMGLVQKLDLVIVEQLFHNLSSLKIQDNFLLFINLSPQDLNHEFMDSVLSTAMAYGIRPERIVFEVTEREAIQDIFKVSNFIKDIKKKGFKFAIDDFGSGYASFLYLKYLPVDFLKIEGEFIKSMKRSRVDKTFVKSMVDVAKGLGIKTVAEYVEDEETLSLLLDLGVDYAQGYFIGKPGHAQEKLKNLFSKGESL